MEFDLTFTILGKLLLACALGGVIGFERALRHKAAGLRTNMFICVGSALFTILSIGLGPRLGLGGDPGRIAAQIIPGIGFIGAGAIIRERGSVVGLTTAATIFAIASVGMAVGIGMYFTATFTSVLIVLGLSLVGWAEQKFIPRAKLMTFRITTPDLETAMNLSHRTLEQLKVSMQHCQIFRVGSEFLMEFGADVLPAQQQELLEKLSSVSSKCEAAPQEAARE